MSEQEREETSPGATRSQHVVLQGPADLRMMAAAMRPGIERSRDAGDTAAPTCLVITPTLEQALAAAEQARRLLGPEAGRVVPVTAVQRARRVLAADPVAVVTGTASDLLSLRRDAALDLQQLQVVVMIGLDELLAAGGASGGAETLQALLGDAPGDVMRVATLETQTESVEAFLEAQLRRARHLTPVIVGDTPLAVTPRFLLTSAGGRAEALRALLDEQDPPSLVIVTNTDAGSAEATAALARLGLTVDGTSVQVTRQPSAQHVALTVLWEAPASYDALVEATAMRPVDAVALLLPEELPTFRLFTGGLAEAWTPAVRKAGAEERVQQVRTALRSTLTNGGATASELALLAPLLETHDALEVAAAAVRLYEGARRDGIALRARQATAGARPSARDAARDAARGDEGTSSGRQRVFLAVGKRDGVRVGDIVGAIANEAEIPGDRIGQVELYESHAIVELSAEDAAKAVGALASSTLRGRRLSAKLDVRGGERGERGGERGRGFDRGFDRGGGARGGDRGFGRGSDRGDREGGREGGRGRGFGGPRGERGERSERGGERHGGDRPGGRSGDRFGGPRGGGSRGGGFEDRGGRDDRGGMRGGGRPPRAADERRAFGDRPVRERAEGRSEWAERSERMKHARRPSRPSFERGDDFDAED